MECLPTNLLDLEETCPISILTKATKITRGPTIDASKFAPGFMLQMDFLFLNVESICIFASTFVAICSSTSYHFGFPSRRKCLTLDSLTFIVNTLRNQDKKVASIRVHEYGSLVISSEYMKTCHNTNIIVQTTCGYASSLNGKTKTPNKTVANITRALLTK